MQPMVRAITVIDHISLPTNRPQYIGKLAPRSPLVASGLKLTNSDDLRDKHAVVLITTW